MDERTREELARIDAELGSLPAGQLVSRRRGGVDWVFRLFKEAGRDRYEPVGPLGSPEEARARDAADRRRELGRRRREIARALDAPGGTRSAGREN